MIEKYLFLTTSHNGKSAITAAFTPVRIVCRNTLNAALSNCEMSVSFRHSADVHQRLNDVAKIMGLVDTRTNELQQLFNQWARIRITDQHVLRLIQMAMAPDSETLTLVQLDQFKRTSAQFQNKVESAYEYAMGSETQQMETTKGTVFGAYNAVTGYYQNVHGYKNNEAKLNSTVYAGLAQKRAQNAFDLCSGYAKDGAEIFQLN